MNINLILKFKHMKTVFMFLLMSMLFTVGNAQTQVNPFLEPDIKPASAYLGLSTGVNNMIGILGPQLEVVVTKNIRVGGGIGLSSWGTKWALNLQVYPNDWYKFFMKAGYSKNSGLDDFETNLELSTGKTESVRMDLNPVGNVFFTAGYAWKVGKRNKFYIEGGYAIPLDTEDYYTLLDPVELSSTSKNVMQLLRPGGLVIALGINFAVGR